jgi:hypothetical protein
MWIRFKSRALFAIHIYLGGVNAVSGEPLMENAATMLRRQNLRFNNKSVQDYVVTPQQLWLDGIASNEGIVRQFVAMPMGSGYSVEAQVSGEELVGGLQFCITPSTRTTKGITIETPTLISLKVQPLVGKIILVDVLDCGYVKDIKYKILKKEGIPTDQQRLVFCGKKLEDGELSVIMKPTCREANTIRSYSARLQHP